MKRTHETLRPETKTRNFGRSIALLALLLGILSSGCFQQQVRVVGQEKCWWETRAFRGNPVKVRVCVQLKDELTQVRKEDFTAWRPEPKWPTTYQGVTPHVPLHQKRKRSRKSAIRALVMAYAAQRNDCWGCRGKRLLHFLRYYDTAKVLLEKPHNWEWSGWMGSWAYAVLTHFQRGTRRYRNTSELQHHCRWSWTLADPLPGFIRKDAKKSMDRLVRLPDYAFFRPRDYHDRADKDAARSWMSCLRRRRRQLGITASMLRRPSSLARLKR